MKRKQKPITICGIPIVYNDAADKDAIFLVRGDILDGEPGQELLKTGVVKLVNLNVRHMG